MSERRRLAVRPLLVAVLLILGLVELQSVIQTVRAQTRARQRVVRGVEAPLVANWAALARATARGNADAWGNALGLLRLRVTGGEIEMFDVDGRPLLADPEPAPVRHWPPSSTVQSLSGGAVATFGPVPGGDPRMLTYTGLPSGRDTVVLRLATPVPDLVEDLKERRGLLVAHASVLVLLTVAGALLAMPQRDPAPAGASDGAYTETIERLRRHGEALTHRHQEELRDLEAMARAGELTAGIAHEVRNGLGTILGYARLLERTPGSEEVALAIQQECETLERVVRAFIDFVRRETLQVASFDAGRMIRRVVAREQVRPGAAVDIGVPEDLSLRGDEELLERAFENFIRNAREAAGERGRVEVTADEGDPAKAVIVVSDTGPGFPPGVEIARPFVSQRPGGLGLGLPIAVKIVRLHGGTVRFGNRQPRGARVEVELPQPAGA